MIQVSHPKIRAQNIKIQNYAPQFEVLEVQILHAPQSEVQSEVQSETQSVVKLRLGTKLRTLKLGHKTVKFKNMCLTLRHLRHKLFK